MMLLLTVISTMVALTTSFSSFPKSLDYSKKFQLFSSDEQTIQDLNLEEMFEVFEAADKTM
jgi:hypothetical protein